MKNMIKKIKLFIQFLLLVLFLLFLRHYLSIEKTSHSKSASGNVEWAKSQTNNFYAIYTFKLNTSNLESEWSKALSKKINGKRENIVSAGRVDVVTENLAIEVDKIDKWHEGVGQALHYGLYTGKYPSLALITSYPNSKKNEERLDVIKNVCKKYDIKLILLMPE